MARIILSPNERETLRPRSRPYLLSRSRNQLAHVISDDDNDSSETLCEEKTPPPTARRGWRHDPDNFMTDEDFHQFLTDLSLNASHLQPPPVDSASNTPIRRTVSLHNSAGRTYKRGKCVELHDGTFLRIQEVVEDGSEVYLRGWRFERFESMESLVPRRINELCWIINLSPGQTESDEKAYDEVGLGEVKGMRIIRLTNHHYPDTSAETDGLFGRDEDRRREGLLFCRTKYIRVWGKKVGREKRVTDAAIVFLNEEEADPGFRVNAEMLRHGWRGVTRLGGSFLHRQRRGERNYIDLSTDGRTPVQVSGRPNKVQKYTFGDAFCGAGGMSRGALQAGLFIQWGFDSCPKAMDTYRLNFPTAIGETSEVCDFLTSDPADIRVDVLHLSPPCKTFSPAKTIAAATDDANEACIFSTRELLDRVKPRIATMEETAGLEQRHKEFLYATIHNFVDLGYSCRWRLMDCQDYGVPQQRKRLVMIGSGPGEMLPSFPPPTHGPAESDLLPYRTILDAIGGLSSEAPNHDPERCMYEMRRLPYDPHNFAKTVTCNGGEKNYHPSGTRTFTHREWACLQTFPIEHRFCGVGVLKQIGNAVPPMLAKSLFRHIVKQLEKTDGIRGRPRP